MEAENLSTTNNNLYTSTPEEEAKSLAKEGRRLLGSGDIQGAINSFKSALSNTPCSFSILKEFSTILIEIGQTQEAKELFENCLSCQPRNIEIINQYAELLTSLGSLEDAIQHFEHCLQIDPVYLPALNGITSILLDKGLYGSAIEVLDKCFPLLAEKEFKPIAPSIALFSRFFRSDFNDQQTKIDKIVESYLLCSSNKYRSDLKKKVLSYFIKAIRAKADHLDLLHSFLALWLRLHTENRKVLYLYLDDVLRANKNDKEKFFEVYECLMDLERDNSENTQRYILSLANYGYFEELTVHLDQVPEQHKIKALNRCAETLRGKGEINLAIECHKLSMTLNKDSISTLNSFTSTLVEAKHYDSALSLINDSLSIDENQVEAILIKAKILSKKEQYDSALSLIEHVLDLDAGNEDALSIYFSTLESFPYSDRIVRAFNRFRGLDIDDCFSLCKQARYELDKGFQQIALVLYQRALEVNDKHQFALIGLGNLLMRCSKYEEAVKFYERALEIDTRDVRTLTSLASALAKLGDFAKAIEVYDRALRIDPQDVKTLTTYANALVKVKSYENADRLYKSAMRIQPSNKVVLSCYGNMLSQKGEFDSSFTYFEKALSIDEKDFITLFHYGNALFRCREYDRAIDILKRALKVDPDDEYIRTIYISSLLQLGKFEEAIELYPQNSYVRLQYAKQLESQGKYDPARKQLLAINLEKAIPYHANVIRLHLGRLYYRLHEAELGKKYFEDAIAHSQGSDDKDKSILYAARSLLAGNPYREEAIELLQQIEASSPRYDEAMKAIALNADSQTSFELFAETEDSFDDTEMLYRAMYHKIGNEVAILKSIAHRLLHKVKGEHPIVSEIVNDLEDLQASVARQRASEKAEIASIPRDDYQQLIEIVSKTAHDISDEVNNILAALESKTRRALRKITDESPLKQSFEKLLAQLELTQTALNDLKSINEGMVIRRHRFPVGQLFEKWKSVNWSSQPSAQKVRISLRIDNPDAEFDGDEEKIKSIINELVENSLKHNSTHSSLSIWISSTDLMNPHDIGMPTIPGDRKYLYIQLSDNGKGVPEDKKEWIFQPLHTTSPEEKGSGLGLFIARKTLQKMGGYIREVGEYGRGSKFQIYIPYPETGDY